MPLARLWDRHYLSRMNALRLTSILFALAMVFLATGCASRKGGGSGISEGDASIMSYSGREEAGGRLGGR